MSTMDSTEQAIKKLNGMKKDLEKKSEQDCCYNFNIKLINLAVHGALIDWNYYYGSLSLKQ